MYVYTRMQYVWERHMYDVVYECIQTRNMVHEVCTETQHSHVQGFDEQIEMRVGM